MVLRALALALATAATESIGALAGTDAPRLPWANDTQPDGPCGITYSTRFSHGGGCAEGTNVPGSPHTYCRSFGKQRAIVSVGSSGHACASLPWRRYDDPARRAVVVTDAAGAVVPSNVTSSSATVGEVCFTAPAAGFFAAYFLPFRWAFGGGSGSYCSFFLKPGESMDPSTPPSDWEPTPGHSAVARFVRFESKTPFDTRSPMEQMASPDEISAMTGAASRQDYLTFVSAISNTSLQSVRLDALPASLVESGPNTTVAASAKPGQFVVIQVAVYALQDLENVTVAFSAVGKVPAEAMTCFQTDGVDANGNTMPQRPWSLSRGKVGTLLIGMSIPQDDATTAELCSATPHAGSFTLTPAGGKPTTISVAVSVECETVSSHEQTGIDTSDLDRLERLAWLNSRVGLASTVTRPYHPLEVNSRAISCLGRTVHFGPTGLPSQIIANGISLLSASGVEFAVTVAGAEQPATWQPESAADADYSISLDPNGTTAQWSVSSTSSDGVLTLTTHGEMSYDGYINLAVSLESTKDVEVDNIALVSSLPQERAKYAIGAGLGDNGAFFPYRNLSKLAWRWSAQAQPGQQPVAGGPITGGTGFRVWVGDVTAGVHLKLKGSDPGWNRPNGDPNLPGGASPGEQPFPTWANGNRGGWGATVDNATHTVSLRGYTGKRSVLKGEPLLFNFSITPTPVKGAYLTSLKAKAEHYHQYLLRTIHR